MWQTPHHVAMGSGSSQMHHRTTEPHSMSPKAASRTTGASRKSRGIVAVQLADAAKTRQAKLADSSYRLRQGGMTSLGGKTHRRLVSSSSYTVALMVLVAVCRAEGLSWSNLKQLDNVGVLYLNHPFLRREGNAARNSFKAAHGQQLGEFLLVLANQPTVSQLLGIRPRNLKRGRSETLSSLQVDTSFSAKMRLSTSCKRTKAV